MNTSGSIFVPPLAPLQGGGCCGGVPEEGGGGGVPGAGPGAGGLAHQREELQPTNPGPAAPPPAPGAPPHPGGAGEEPPAPPAPPPSLYSANHPTSPPPRGIWLAGGPLLP